MNAGMRPPALVLNADFRPLSYFPLSLWSWQDSIKAVFLDRVTIISEYEGGGKLAFYGNAASFGDCPKRIYSPEP